MNQQEKTLLVKLRKEGKTWKEISKQLKGYTENAVRKAYNREVDKPQLRVLVLDIETAPLESWTWGTFDQNVSLNQIKTDWSILSYSAKWLGSDEILYEDTSRQKNVRDDSKLLKSLWKLIDEADVLLGQNLTSFDCKKLNARFILNNFHPPSSYRQIDTMRMAKKSFAFTSNKLEYLTRNLCVKNKKSSHVKYPGFELWKACLSGDKEAWKEMREYNIVDILSTEELYYRLAPWNNAINFNVAKEELSTQCVCGSESFKKKGYVYTNSAKYQRHICDKCGAEYREKQNQLSKAKKLSLKK